jgi:pimeloyl-ACP methyl ester carboxylesterase
VLVGCGTFDTKARARLQATLGERARQNESADRLYTYSRAVAEPPIELDAKGHTETWNDMLRLQAEGVYPAAFAAIACPVLMLHGAYDPHPGEMIRDGLARYIPQLEYVELERCGHSPWIEEHARDRFFSVLRTWLSRHTT